MTVETCSILWRDKSAPEGAKEPACFKDLNLDQVVEAIVKPRSSYNLTPLFWLPLRDPELVRFRQEVMKDLEGQGFLPLLKEFSEEMERVQRNLAIAAKSDSAPHRQGWFLEAALRYCAAVKKLSQDLDSLDPRSEGLLTFRDCLREYIASPEFQELCATARKVKEALAAIRYSIVIEPGKFRVKRYEGEPDYSLEVEKTFAKFQQRQAKDYLVRFQGRAGMGHVEMKILEFVAKLYPQPFAQLADFYSRHQDFIAAPVATFHREIQFYIACLDFLAPLKGAGLPFCYPEVSSDAKEEQVVQSFDLALAVALQQSGGEVVRNDFYLREPERIIVVTGPNQGGKTTFARMVGQLHYLASLGCPIPGAKAKLFLPDQIFTHFEREEEVASLRGRLEDDLVRIKEVLDQATPASLFILNEIFSSTTLQDALTLSEEVLEKLLELDALGVWVTFLDELASYGERVVSMVASVDPNDPTVRTFKIVRRAADGLAYALSLAHKHGLTYDQVKERIRP